MDTLAIVLKDPSAMLTSSAPKSRDVVQTVSVVILWLVLMANVLRHVSAESMPNALSRTTKHHANVPMATLETLPKVADHPQTLVIQTLAEPTLFANLTEETQSAIVPKE